MHKKSMVALACISAFGLASPSISANDSVNISGFLTTGVSITDNETPYLHQRDFTDEINFHSDSVLGIQLDSTVDDKTRVSAQLIANFTSDNFDTNAEWLFVERRVTPELRLRAGRLRLPVYAASRYVYVGSAYPWVRPPEEVYSLLAGITRFSGLDAIWQTQLGDSTFSIHPYAGSIKGEEIVFSSQVVELNTDSLFGVRAELSFENITVQASTIRIDGTIDNFPIGPGLGTVSIESNSELVSLALQIEQGKFDFRTEWANRDNSQLGESWGWYGTLAYHHNQFTPYVTLGLRDSKRNPQSQLSAETVNRITRDSESAALGLRWDLGPKIALKSELHYGKAKGPSQGLFSEYIPDPEDPNRLADNDVLLASFTVNVLF